MMHANHKFEVPGSVKVSKAQSQGEVILINVKHRIRGREMFHFQYSKSKQNKT